MSRIAWRNSCLITKCFSHPRKKETENKEWEDETWDCQSQSVSLPLSSDVKAGSHSALARPLEGMLIPSLRNCHMTFESTAYSEESSVNNNNKTAPPPPHPPQASPWTASVFPEPRLDLFLGSGLISLGHLLASLPCLAFLLLPPPRLILPTVHGVSSVSPSQPWSPARPQTSSVWGRSVFVIISPSLRKQQISMGFSE